MNEIICILSFVVAFVCAKSDLYDIGANHERIQNYFQECSTLNVLLRNFEQPEGVINWLDGILGTGNKSFVVFNIANRSDHEKFHEQCMIFQSNPSIRVAYLERELKKSYRNIKGFELLESELNLAVTNGINEEFSEMLDKWRILRHEGYILFTSLENLEYYVECLGNRHGTFLFIVVSAINDKNYKQKVEEIFRLAWKSFGNFKVAILVNRQLFTYNPFKRVANGTYGAIKLFQGLYTDDDLTHINLYPLNVEIFWSAFSLTHGNADIKKFKGPDVNVTMMIANRLNSSCK